MTRKDVKKLLAMIQATYPNYKPEDEQAAVNAWCIALEEYNENAIALAFKAYMTTDTSGFAPSPGQLIAKMQAVKSPQELSELQAWELVRSTLNRCGYYAEEEFAKLPELVQKAVGSPGQLRTWATDENFEESVASSNFMRCYRSELARKKEVERMPESVKKLMERINENSEKKKLERRNQEQIESVNERKRLETLEEKVIPIRERVSTERLEEEMEKLRRDFG